MNPWTHLEIEKRKRLVAKDVLPTTFTGVYDVLKRNSKAVSTFPHLLTPINQPFRKYQAFFGKYTYDNVRGTYNHYDAEGLNLLFVKYIPLSPSYPEDKNNICQILSKFTDRIKNNPNKFEEGYYFFVDQEEIIYLVHKKSDQTFIFTLKDEFYYPQNKDLHNLAIKALDIEKNNECAFYSKEQVYTKGGIFIKMFNETLIYATYKEARHSLIEKMKDNLYQLLMAHPYYIGAAIYKASIPSLFYHLLGVFHAAISLILDPLVELIAIVTRSLFAPKPDTQEQLFPEDYEAPTKITLS